MYTHVCIRKSMLISVTFNKKFFICFHKHSVVCIPHLSSNFIMGSYLKLINWSKSFMWGYLGCPQKFIINISGTVKGLWFHSTEKITSYHGSYTDDDKSHTAPESEMKNFILHRNSSSQSQHFSCQFPKLQFPLCSEKRAKWQLNMQWGPLQQGNSWLREPQAFIAGISMLVISFWESGYGHCACR